ncbi:ACT domain protein [Candidatus Bilamarchaeum dharawalense]|uniref:ACT domain protein n=1 Tax=Candidatus Bilamarchaeum dharawalense TaxID=2885759 RepID=A0A5E4LL59_9ARCH|nr:ACT domain protein [Candidatus Bilamarchaeum dharawalense]
MKEITIVASNDVGSLAAVAETLGSVGVNIEAISAYGSDNNAVFRVLTNDVATATRALSKLPQFKITEADTIIYKMINRPGELGKVTRKLANRGISLESVYIVSKKQDYTDVAICPSQKDMAKTREVLGIK